MLDKQEAAIFKSKQDFNQNKEKILNIINMQKAGKSYRYMFLYCNGM